LERTLSHDNNAEKIFPKCILPVGEGANLPTFLVLHCSIYLHGQIYSEYSMKKIANVGRMPVRDGNANFLSQIYSEYSMKITLLPYKMPLLGQYAKLSHQT